MTSLDRLVNLVAEHFDLAPDVLTAPGKQARRISYARHVGAYIAIAVQKQTYEDTAGAFGLGEQTSARYGYRRIREYLELGHPRIFCGHCPAEDVATLTKLIEADRRAA
ncbi:hypothetical protein [Methyloceanibacter caenitepidi]|uniref:Chromosomal replication initiator DnaA C-terminal domain-containing protein n=1 Tax=Methyloceanibacter caenitepidi TaxID=1384459 RepID=A0A0A8K4N2_9HYPH|nr:hypothetical protein [Methyloceanibacter caenitepidi]BAQ16959.1 hypothetical protein GL4_1503 [Methyloceanibacter caenitepidi]